MLESGQVLDKYDTRPRLTSYEEARLKGTRAQQLQNGSESMLDDTGSHDVIMIAAKEFDEGKIQ